MITNKNEAKTMRKNISCGCKFHVIVQLATEIKNVITKHVDMNVKIIIHTKKIIVGILAHAFERIASI